LDPISTQLGYTTSTPAHIHAHGVFQTSPRILFFNPHRIPVSFKPVPIFIQSSTEAIVSSVRQSFIVLPAKEKFPFVCGILESPHPASA